MTFVAQGNEVSQSGVHCRLKVSENIYAGQLLRAILTLTSKVPGVFISLAGMRLGARLDITSHAEHGLSQDLKMLLMPTSPAETAYGGGKLFTTDSPTVEGGEATFKSHSILSQPHTIIPINTILEPCVEYSYEWIIRLPRSMLPSIKRGALFIIRYFVEAGVKAKDLPDLTLTHRVNIFPAFHSGELLKTLRLFQRDMYKSLERAHIAILTPRRAQQETVMDLYNRHEKCPTMSDFIHYPRHPLSGPARSPDDFSDDQLYQAMAGSAPPVSFLLESPSTGHVATIRLARNVLRIGEEVMCTVTFADSERPSAVDVFQVLAEITCTEIISSNGSEIEEAQPKQWAGSSPSLRHRHLVLRHEEMCWLHQHLSFSLSLPAGAAAYPPSLSTDLGSVEWAFEMILICAPHPHGSPQLTVTPVGPDKNIIQCRVPLRILPNLAACSLRCEGSR